MHIDIQTIPHASQMYNTCGNFWTTPEGKLYISVSHLGNETYELLIAIHELIERESCRRTGVTEDEITAFDRAYEQAREQDRTAPCGCSVHDEPGMDIHAPYHAHHVAATGVEMILVSLWGVQWAEYEKALASLDTERYISS